MNPTLMSMLVKARQVEIDQEVGKHRVFSGSRQSADSRKSMQILTFSLATIGVLMLLVMWAIVVI